MKKLPSYAITVFLSALLLFMVQPLISKYFLPWFGGSASLWATTMVVFQLLLLGGYLYVHVGARRLTPIQHLSVHLTLVVVALVVLGFQWFQWGIPLLPTEQWAPDSLDQPILRVFLLLSVTIGVPYFLLSTTSPLLQYWYGHVNEDGDPYRLYALSNAGSLIGLLAYPVLVEPLFTIRNQSLLWSGIFLVSSISLGWASFRFYESIDRGEQLDLEAIRFPGWRTWGLWFVWAAFPSALFLAVTNRLSQIAPVVPFLWVVPLGIYLISLIICFAWRDAYSRDLYTLLWIPSIACVIVTLFYPFRTALPFHLIILCYMLYLGCMIGHGELSKRRPKHERLTAFYITLAAGGAGGGIFVSLLSPWIFDGYWELHTLLFVGLIAVLVLLAKVSSSWLKSLPKAVSAPLLLIVWVGIEMLLLSHVYLFIENSVYLSRNFYGVTRVIDRGMFSNRVPRRILKHGDTRHGSQYLTRGKRRKPTGYYTRQSGVGRAIRSRKAKLDRGIHVGVVGLGAGVLATYGDTRDSFRFYEINPDVIDLATRPDPMFTFLPNCPCQTTVIKGDARLSMSREWERSGSMNYDVLVIDVFQNDSPPAHLLTIEAFRLYQKHLSEGGILAFHVSNRYLKIQQLIHQYARIEGLHDRQIISVKRGLPARWMVISSSPDALKGPAYENAIVRPIRGEHVPLWTDQYSNLISLIEWRLPGVFR